MNTILIIDDDKGYAKDLRALLEGDGFDEVVCAHTTHEGEVLINERRPSAVVLDLMLPKHAKDDIRKKMINVQQTSGFQLADRLRQSGFDMRRIIVITTLFKPEHLDPVRELGVFRVFSKPTLVKDIRQAIEDVLALPDAS